MDIVVSAKGGKPVGIYPDPASVVVGENISWELYYDGRDENLTDSIEWTVYFSNGGPFETWENRTVQTDPKAGPEQKGRLEGGSATSPGDYKYGIRVSNARTKVLLSDDDPRLIVRPSSR